MKLSHGLIFLQKKALICNNFESQIYLFLHLSAPSRDVVTCTHTPGGLLTVQRPLSAWVSSSRTPPLLPEERKREKVSYGAGSHGIITLRRASVADECTHSLPIR